MRREDAVEQVASTLLPQASLLARLVAKQACWTLTRSEGSVLSTLSEAPQRITTLAELEGLAQPTVTIMVKRLEERGWVARDRDSLDGRVVLVSITHGGPRGAGVASASSTGRCCASRWRRWTTPRSPSSCGRRRRWPGWSRRSRTAPARASTRPRRYGGFWRARPPLPGRGRRTRTTGMRAPAAAGSDDRCSRQRSTVFPVTRTGAPELRIRSEGASDTGLGVRG